MAWRLHEHVLRGEIDNRARGRVTGRVWLAGIVRVTTTRAFLQEITEATEIREINYSVSSVSSC